MAARRGVRVKSSACRSRHTRIGLLVVLIAITGSRSRNFVRPRSTANPSARADRLRRPARSSHRRCEAPLRNAADRTEEFLREDGVQPCRQRRVRFGNPFQRSVGGVTRRWVPSTLVIATAGSETEMSSRNPQDVPPGRGHKAAVAPGRCPRTLAGAGR